MWMIVNFNHTTFENRFFLHLYTSYTKGVKSHLKKHGMLQLLTYVFKNSAEVVSHNIIFCGYICYFYKGAFARIAAYI